MSFVSSEFALFFCLVMPLYFAVPYAWRWLYLLVTSYVFYAYYNRYFVLILIATIAIDYFIARAMARTDDAGRRRACLGLSLVINFGVLFVFKYFNFFNDAAASLFANAGLPYAIADLSLILPVGISFYTFEEVSYIVDVYRRKVQPETRFGVFANFVIFFPKLVAGPIERAGHLMPQFDRRVDFEYARVVSGCRLILWGLFKKVVIADRLAMYVNPVYNDPTAYSGTPLLVATVFFAFQIYCDFSAYTDIAIGLARIMGIDLLENFRQPYLATSVRDFWRRWHISLSSWFRDYLYLPLGGSRGSLPRTLVNLFVVFVVSGLWHGANWTFVVWGALHGTYVVTETLLSTGKPATTPDRGWPMFLRGALTFVLVGFAWIFFRANSIDDAFYIVSHLFAAPSDNLFAPFASGVFGMRVEFVLSVALIGGLLVLERFDRQRGLLEMFARRSPAGRWTTYYAMAAAIVVSLLDSASTSNFIYFQF